MSAQQQLLHWWWVRGIKGHAPVAGFKINGVLRILRIKKMWEKKKSSARGMAAIGEVREVTSGMGTNAIKEPFTPGTSRSDHQKGSSQSTITEARSLHYIITEVWRQKWQINIFLMPCFHGFRKIKIAPFFRDEWMLYSGIMWFIFAPCVPPATTEDSYLHISTSEMN